MDFCNNWELEEKARSFEMKTRLDQMDAMCNVQPSIDSQLLKMNAQVNKSLMNSYNMLDTAMCAPMCANYTVYYADNMPVKMMTWQHESKSKIDIFEAMNLLIFPYDPIRDYTKREIEKINERFKPIEDLIDFAYPYEIPKERGCAKLDRKGHMAGRIILI